MTGERIEGRIKWEDINNITILEIVLNKLYGSYKLTKEAGIDISYRASLEIHGKLINIHISEEMEENEKGEELNLTILKPLNFTQTEAEEIIISIVKYFGGYVKFDKDSEKWIKIKKENKINLDYKMINFHEKLKNTFNYLEIRKLYNNLDKIVPLIAQEALELPKIEFTEQDGIDHSVNNKFYYLNVKLVMAPEYNYYIVQLTDPNNENTTKSYVTIGENEMIKNIMDFNKNCSKLFGFEFIE